MKIKKILISLVFTLCLFCLFGCGGGNSNPELNIYEANLSEYRKNLFIFKNSNYLVTLTSGERELDYVMDGNVTTLKDFGVITIKFAKQFNDDNLKFELKVDNDTYAGELEHNPFDNTFVYDIGKQIDDNSKISLYLVDFDETLSLECLSKNWPTTYKTALNVFTEAHKKQIDVASENGKLQGEIYIKTVAENENLTDIYWYVLLVCKNGDMCASLISTATGEILQTN